MAKYSNLYTDYFRPSGSNRPGTTTTTKGSTLHHYSEKEIASVTLSGFEQLDKSQDFSVLLTAFCFVHGSQNCSAASTGVSNIAKYHRFEARREACVRVQDSM